MTLGSSPRRKSLCNYLLNRINAIDNNIGEEMISNLHAAGPHTIEWAGVILEAWRKKLAALSDSREG